MTTARLKEAQGMIALPIVSDEKTCTIPMRRFSVYTQWFMHGRVEVTLFTHGKRTVHEITEKVAEDGASELQVPDFGTIRCTQSGNMHIEFEDPGWSVFSADYAVYMPSQENPGVSSPSGTVENVATDGF